MIKKSDGWFQRTKKSDWNINKEHADALWKKSKMEKALRKLFLEDYTVLFVLFLLAC